MDSYGEKTKTLIEALPYIRKFHGARVVVKYGGNVMTSPKAERSAMTDIVLMKHVGMNPIVVHGGGPEVTGRMRKAGVEPKWVGGLRVTDAETLGHVRAGLTEINERICAHVARAGGKPIGLIAVKNVVFVARQKSRKLGLVGEVEEVDSRVLDSLLAADYIPVVAPLGVDREGQVYNINADTSATALACAVRARKLTVLTNVPGVLDEDGRRVAKLTIAEARKLIADGTIAGGMIPKVEAAIEAVSRGVRQAHFLDGTVEHCMLLEFFTRKGIGTMILR